MAFTPNYDTPQLQEPIVGWATHAAANTAKDGTGTVATLLTAGASGAQFFRVKAVPLGTNDPSVLRLFVSNGSGTSTAANNSLIEEVSLPQTTLTEVAAQTPLYIDLNIDVAAGHLLTSCIGTAVAAGWQVTARGRNY